MPSTAFEAKNLANLAKDLKAKSRGDLRRLLLKNIRVASAPLLAEARKSALETLPKTGGLNTLVASGSFRSRTSLSGTSARVRLVASEPHHIKTIDRGTVRHPVYGNRDNWVTQEVTPGWWTRPMEAGSPRVRSAIVRTAEEIGRQIHG